MWVIGLAIDFLVDLCWELGAKLIQFKTNPSSVADKWCHYQFNTPSISYLTLVQKKYDFIPTVHSFWSLKDGVSTILVPKNGKIETKLYLK